MWQGGVEREGGREGGQVFCKAETGYQDNLKPQHFCALSEQ